LIVHFICVYSTSALDAYQQTSQFIGNSNLIASNVAKNGSTTSFQQLMADDHGKSLQSGRVVHVKPGVSIQMIQIDHGMWSKIHSRVLL